MKHIIVSFLFFGLLFNPCLKAQTKFDTLSYKIKYEFPEDNTHPMNKTLTNSNFVQFPATKIGAVAGFVTGFSIGYLVALKDPNNNFLRPAMAGVLLGVLGMASGALIGATLDEFVFYE